MLLLPLLLAATAAALNIHGNAVHLSARIPEEREGRLWVLQSKVIPDTVHGYLGHHTFVVSSLRGITEGNVSELHPEVSQHSRQTDAAAAQV